MTQSLTKKKKTNYTWMLLGLLRAWFSSPRNEQTSLIQNLDQNNVYFLSICYSGIPRSPIKCTQLNCLKMLFSLTFSSANSASDQLSSQSAEHNQQKCKNPVQSLAQYKKTNYYLNLKYIKLLLTHKSVHIHSGILKMTVFSICLAIG